jgi:hypothetical protein
LKEQATAGLKPANKKELYNLRHATLHNIVERIFGCMKRKFPVLQSASEIELKKQVHLVYALCALWNFIRHHEGLDNLFDNPNEDARVPARTSMDEETFNLAEEDSRMNHRRKQLATKLWNQYCDYNSSRA